MVQIEWYNLKFMERKEKQGLELLEPIPPLYFADNIGDFLKSRAVILEDAIKDYRQKKEIVEKIKQERSNELDWIMRLGLTGIRTLNWNPEAKSSFFGKFETHSVRTSAFIFIPTVRHSTERDRNKKHDIITIFDNTGECEVQLPDALIAKFLQKVGLRSHPPDLLKKQVWASDILLFSNFYEVNGEGQDKHYVIHAENKHISGGKLIPTIAAELRGRGIQIESYH